MPAKRPRTSFEQPFGAHFPSQSRYWRSRDCRSHGAPRRSESIRHSGLTYWACCIPEVTLRRLSETGVTERFGRCRRALATLGREARKGVSQLDHGIRVEGTSVWKSILVRELRKGRECFHARDPVDRARMQIEIGEI